MRNENIEIMNETTLNLIKLLRKNNKNGERMTSLAISERLGVKPRTIRKHKELAVKFGYNIQSFNGNNPGYELIEERLTDDEVEQIKNNLPENLVNKILRISDRI